MDDLTWTLVIFTLTVSDRLYGTVFIREKLNHWKSISLMDVCQDSIVNL